MPSLLMRLLSGILIVALIAGFALYLAGRAAIIPRLMPLPFFIALGVGLLLCIVTTMTQNPVEIRELVKQIAVWLGIVVLLPLAVWYVASAFSPPPDWEKFRDSISKVETKLRKADEAETAKLESEKDRLEKELKEAERIYYGHMFWVAYPVGLLAIIVGLYYSVQSVGAGLMFGGLSSLARQVATRTGTLWMGGCGRLRSWLLW